MGEGLQNTAGDLEAAVGESQTGQSNHRIAAPVAEPWITRDHGLLVTSGNDVIAGGLTQILYKAVLHRRTHADLPPPG